MRQRSHKTWFITGSSSGFGRALTETLLERGNRVAATLRKVNALDDLKEQYGEQIWVAPLDVTDTTAVRAVVERAFDHMGRIDVVVNNAGYGLFGAAEEVSDDQIQRQIDTNLIGSIQVIRAALPLLRAQGGGRILQLSSAGGQTTFPNFSLYTQPSGRLRASSRRLRKKSRILISSSRSLNRASPKQTLALALSARP